MKPDPAAYELAYVEARRALDDQREVLNEIRSRAGLLLAAAALTTSFFGDAALADGMLGTGGWLAIAAFASLGACVLVILWPRRDWSFVVDAEELVATYLESEAGPIDIPRIHRDLALHMARRLQGHRGHVRRLAVTLQCGAVLLVVDVVLWCVALIAQGL